MTAVYASEVQPETGKSLSISLFLNENQLKIEFNFKSNRKNCTTSAIWHTDAKGGLLFVIV
jgi:hypothetical protein